jgi:tripartite-type tricarboxylate transporter receptor subunit TctC
MAVEPWYGILVPAGTPPAIVGTLNRTLLQMLRTPQVQQRFEQLGYRALESSPEELEAIIHAETRTFAILVDAVKPDAQR